MPNTLIFDRVWDLKERIIVPKEPGGAVCGESRKHGFEWEGQRATSGSTPNYPKAALRLVTANLKARSAKLLSGVISGWSRKYHHWSAFSFKFRNNLPAS
ncbi:hypothetical protein NIES4102_42420 (plasmid) [Chondrocystis sp. NIES-4102]|nr:hypothetical protein NIES4102_42420 [Chondrocystis sp. NIES-4102]